MQRHEKGWITFKIRLARTCLFGPEIRLHRRRAVVLNQSGHQVHFCCRRAACVQLPCRHDPCGVEGTWGRRRGNGGALGMYVPVHACGTINALLLAALAVHPTRPSITQQPWVARSFVSSTFRPICERRAARSTPSCITYAGFKCMQCSIDRPQERLTASANTARRRLQERAVAAMGAGDDAGQGGRVPDRQGEGAWSAATPV